MLICWIFPHHIDLKYWCTHPDSGFGFKWTLIPVYASITLKVVEIYMWYFQLQQVTFQSVNFRRLVSIYAWYIVIYSFPFQTDDLYLAYLPVPQFYGNWLYLVNTTIACRYELLLRKCDSHGLLGQLVHNRIKQAEKFSSQWRSIGPFPTSNQINPSNGCSIGVHCLIGVFQAKQGPSGSCFIRNVH